MEKFEGPILRILRITLSDKNKETNAGKYTIMRNGKEFKVPHRNVEIHFATTKDSVITDCIRVLNSINGTKNIESLNINV